MIRHLCGLVVAAFLSSQASAQYGVNWPKQPDTPMATGVLPGQQVLRVSGVNDFLYTYEINFVEITTPVSLPSIIPSGAAGGCDVPEVQSLQNDFNSAYAGYKNDLFPSSAAPSKSLEETQTVWKNKISSFYDKLDKEITAANSAVASLPPDTERPVKKKCQDTVDSISQDYHHDLQPAYEKLFAPAHAIDVPFEAKVCKSVIFTITERYKGTSTGQIVVARLDAECDELTASGGILLTEIQNRTYTSVPLPSQTGQFLAVGGTGKFRPVFVALTNFNFPFEPFGHKTSARLGDMKLGLSIGPVIASSKSDVSSFGWFFGGSVSFLHRLYVSPGVHVGEFADFPLGFTANQQIPANFGTPTPVKRWTTRLGIALTIKGWDISKAVKGGTENPAPATKTTVKGGSGNPAPAPKTSQ